MHVMWYLISSLNKEINYEKKNENFQIKNSDIFHISTQNINLCTRLTRRV